jgi:hypothetical protein
MPLRPSVPSVTLCVKMVPPVSSEPVPGDLEVLRGPVTRGGNSVQVP